MIQKQPPPRQAQSLEPERKAPAWQHELRQAYTRPHDLLEYLQLDPRLPALQVQALGDFPLRVPRGFAARMRKGDPLDPLFLQVWPQPDEGKVVPGFSSDAVGDLDRLRQGGVVHKYRGRVLVIATGACAVHCRYCFRRHFPYADALAAREHWREALQTIHSDPSIEEVILSGGDPLSLSDDKLAVFAESLEGIAHVQRLRIHTRQPVVLPERVDERLMAWMGRGRLQKIVVLHANHANELDDSVQRALAPLREAGIPLLNQAVLLRNINDTPEALVNLSKRLFTCGVLPYYLHLLDRVQGAAHFEVSASAAQALMREISSHLPGYLVPRLAREEQGMAAKTMVAW